MKSVFVLTLNTKTVKLGFTDFNVNLKFLPDTEDFIDVENLNTWDVEVGENASFSSRYYCKQWQAFKIVKLSSKLQQLELEEVFVSVSMCRAGCYQLAIFSHSCFCKFLLQ